MGNLFNKSNQDKAYKKLELKTQEIEIIDPKWPKPTLSETDYYKVVWKMSIIQQENQDIDC